MFTYVFADALVQWALLAYYTSAQMDALLADYRTASAQDTQTQAASSNGVPVACTWDANMKWPSGPRLKVGWHKGRRRLGQGSCPSLRSQAHAEHRSLIGLQNSWPSWRDKWDGFRPGTKTQKRVMVDQVLNERELEVGSRDEVAHGPEGLFNVILGQTVHVTS